MNILEKKILKSLYRHGELSQTGLYRYFHRYRAQRKNEAMERLVSTNFIYKDVRRSNDKARKPTQYFKLSELGIAYLNNETDQIPSNPKPKRKRSNSSFF